MLAFLQALSRTAFQASACALRFRRVSVCLMQSDGAILTTYVSVPLTGPDAVMQVYMFTGMPFPVKPGFFVHIKSEFQYIAISKRDVKFQAMTLNNFLKCKRVGDSYFCKDGNVVRDVPNY
jgi:hypothetical protein